MTLVLPGIWTHFTRARLRDQIHLLLLHHPPRSQSNLSTPDTMAAIKSLMTRDEVVHQLAKRQNWAAKEPGVIVVFCIVGVVAIGLLSLFLYRKAIARKANKASTV
ncbi:hypothetical protein HZS61_003968 [Fusarium oxysporum f. sp. conglutinans]|uniref:Uncharacterized protein n=1 Tax=Fusarium oxysporum f. sp. conglutinans TaxID=100902 RepID=A0A8H6GG75_FUSOX|nr:hypothetical protein HZS61_003968 [Fusarium oxysporum f. sp. conglutinans]